MNCKICLIGIVVLFSISCSKDEEPLLLFPEMENEFFEAINEHRDTLELNVLLLNAKMASLAREHSQYMVKQSTLSHDGFNENRAPAIQNEGFSLVGENVAFGGNVNSIINAWLESEGHKNNIEGDYTHSGIGVAKGNDDRYYVTQIFAK